MNNHRTPLTRESLDENCECVHCKKQTGDKFYFTGRCHPDAATYTYYTKNTGMLTIECGVCRKMIAQVRVARALIEL